MELRIVDRDEALATLEPTAVRDALRSAFAGLLTGTSVQPAQTLIDLPGGGDCIYYPGALGDLVGVKVSPYLAPRLDRPGEPPVTAYTLLLSARTGRPILLCDALALTTVRTAATTALALEYLTQDDATSLAVLGAGPVALEHLRFVLAQRVWDQVQIYAPSLAGSGPLANERRAQLSQFPVAIAGSAREAVAGADVVLLCTSSATPVIEPGWLRPGATVTSITTTAAHAHEVPPAALSTFAVFCDYRSTAPFTAGEMLLAAEAGGWSTTDILGDLPELVTGRVARPAGATVFFRSTGLGIEDLAVAGLLIDHQEID
jgi:L-arginine dehydrogenase